MEDRVSFFEYVFCSNDTNVELTTNTNEETTAKNDNNILLATKNNEQDDTTKNKKLGNSKKAKKPKRSKRPSKNKNNEKESKMFEKTPNVDREEVFDALSKMQPFNNNVEENKEGVLPSDNINDTTNITTEQLDDIVEKNIETENLDKIIESNVEKAKEDKIEENNISQKEETTSIETENKEKTIEEKENALESILEKSKDSDVLNILNDVKKDENENNIKEESGGAIDGLEELQKLVSEVENSSPNIQSVNNDVKNNINKKEKITTDDDLLSLESDKAFENLQKLAEDVEKNNLDDYEKDFKIEDNVVDKNNNLVNIEIIDIPTKKINDKNVEESKESKVDIPMI